MEKNWYVIHTYSGYENKVNSTRGAYQAVDGRRFLMVKLDERRPQPVNEMILVQNWFEELGRLRPKTETQ